MSKLIDEVGNRYGRLVVLEYAGLDKNHLSTWLCQCDCGEQVRVLGGNLRSGNSKSCGCGRVKDETGKRYDRWVVLRLGTNRNNKIMWLCKCDCGTLREVSGTSLRCGGSTSCGCSRGLSKGEAAGNVLYSNYRLVAKQKGLDWQLTKEQFFCLTQQSCFYCGAEPSQIRQHKECNGVYVYNGIDRVDNKSGYTTENVVPCCKTCNRAKRKMPVAEFKRWVQQVYQHWVHPGKSLKGVG